MAMKKLIAIGALVALIVLLPACKGSTTPLTVELINMAATNAWVYIGDTARIHASARMTDNSNQSITNGTWASDNTSVATVDNTGVVTAVGSGLVNITVTFGGKTGTKQLRCLPNYAGTWTGTYTVTACAASGDFDLYGFCGVVPAGTVLNTDLVLTQSGDQITGQLFLGTLSATATGPIAIDGHLNLTGRVIEGDFTIDTAYTLQSTVPGEITGDMTQLWLALAATWLGQGQLTCVMNTVTRSTTMQREPGVVGLQGLPPNPTLQDLLNALRRR
jgi:hypothetical protein